VKVGCFILPYGCVRSAECEIWRTNFIALLRCVSFYEDLSNRLIVKMVQPKSRDHRVTHLLQIYLTNKAISLPQFILFSQERCQTAVGCKATTSVALISSPRQKNRNHFPAFRAPLHLGFPLKWLPKQLHSKFEQNNFLFLLLNKRTKLLPDFFSDDKMCFKKRVYTNYIKKVK